MNWKLIIIEWLDGSGKDTQADILVERYWYIKTRLPFYDNKTGELIKKINDTQKEWVSEEFYQTLMATNYIEHLDNVILPLIESWKTVVMTRHTPSMMAYGRSFWIDHRFVFSLFCLLNTHYENKIWLLNVKKIYLDISPELSLTRIKKRDEESNQKIQDLFENEQRINSIHKEYEHIKKWAFDHIVNWNQSIDNIAKEIAFYIFK